MVKKRNRVKKNSALEKSKSNPNVFCCNEYFGKGYGMIKLSSMAFILFLITVWPRAMNLVNSIHWGWFLGATIVFGAIAMGKVYPCRKK